MHINIIIDLNSSQHYRHFKKKTHELLAHFNKSKLQSINEFEK